MRAPVEVAGAPVLQGPWCWSLAYGSNASAERLIDKALDASGAIVLPASVLGWTRAWEARRTTSTGAIPLTLQPAPGTRLDVAMLGLLPADAELLDASEGRGPNYTLCRVGPAAVGARFLLPEAVAYGPTERTRVLLDGGRVATFPAVDQARAGMLFAADPVLSVRAEPADTVEGWPETPLDDLPLLVYGSLQPDMSRWRHIAAHVEVIGPAEARGILTATVFGWPAASFTGRRRLHGTLLRPRSVEAAAQLYRIADRIEDVPALFRRVAVPVLVEHELRWAASYEWNPEQGPPPGSLLEEGRWVP